VIASADTSNMAAAAKYQTAAEQRIMEILAEQHAAVRRELESRIAEGYWPSSGLNINPQVRVGSQNPVRQYH
jgi:hypothetical protein